jgi:hypothetical protein
MRIWDERSRGLNEQPNNHMQAILLCNRARKPSDPLDRDPIVRHI